MLYVAAWILFLFILAAGVKPDVGIWLFGAAVVMHFFR